MMSRKFLSVGFALAIVFAGAPAFAQFGVFEKTADWGDTNSPPKVGTYKAAGSVSVANGVYTMKGNGDDIWGNNDEGFFVYKEMTGSWSLSGKVKWVSNGGGNEWAKAGVMLRENATAAGSRHYWVELRSAATATGDRTDAQWRVTADAASDGAELRTPDNQAVNDKGDGVWLRVSRLASANLVLSEYSYDGVNWVYGNVRQMTFQDKIAYGLTITNHLDNDQLAEATVSDVKLVDVVPAAGIRSWSITDPVYIGGDPITVSLLIGGGAGTVKVTETPPAGWTIGQISDGGSASGGVITWSITTPKTVTYVVTPPVGTTAAATFSGKADSTTIGGVYSLTAPSPIEIFDNHLDVGAVGAAGSAEYNKTDKRYIVSGSGADIWDAADEFHFVYKKISGAFSLEGMVFAYNDSGTNEWSKAGFMIRDNLNAGSPHLMGIVRGSDGQYDSQWRANADSSSGDTGLKANETGEIKLTRSGTTVEAYYMGTDGNWVRDTAQTIALSDPVYVGLCVTSHDDGNFSVGEFENIKLTLYPFQIVKTFSEKEVTQGGSLDVLVSVAVREGQTTNIAIKETYSAATSVSNLKASAGQAIDDKKGNITWNVTGGTGTITLQYTVNVPGNYAESFVNFGGTFDDGKGYTGDTGTSAVAVKPANLGIFQGHQDIGAVGAPGNVKVEGDSYQVIGSGDDIWNAADAFHYLWVKVTGDFSLSIDEPYVGAYGTIPSTNDWMKMGIMARQDLTAPAAYVYACLRASDQAMMIQWRDTNAGSASWTDGSQTTVADWNPNYDPAFPETGRPTLDQVKLGGAMKMVREGDSFTLYYVYNNEDVYQNTHDTVMTDPIYVGVAVTAHQTGATAQGLFKRPILTGKTVSVGSWMLY